jgi:hypothetical protein
VTDPVAIQCATKQRRAGCSRTAEPRDVTYVRNIVKYYIAYKLQLEAFENYRKVRHTETSRRIH